MKKFIVLQLVTFASIASLLGCGSWTQDPLAKAKGMGQGQSEPDVKPEKPALPPDYIIIDAPLFKLVKEGVEAEIKIDARVILPDYTLTVEVANLAQFPGAAFDSATNTFKWTPAVGTATDDISELSLNFVATATAPGKVAVQKSKVTQVGVARTLLEPTIVEVSSLTPELREGTRDYFYVVVEDVTAGNDPAKFPYLLARNTPGVPSMATLVEVSRASKDSINKFEYVVEMNLSDAELTKDRTELGFELVPVSHFQKHGAPRVIRYDILTRLVDVTSTWTNAIAAAPGTVIDYQFLVLDPKQEGEVKLDTVDTLPAGATFDCPVRRSESILACRFVWNVPADASGDYEVSAKFLNASRDYSDTHSVATYLDFPISIGARGSVLGGRK